MIRLSGPGRIDPRYYWGIQLVLPIPLARFGQARLNDGRWLTIGGIDTSGVGTLTPRCFLFAADGQSFSEVGALPVAELNMVATTLGDGRVLAISNQELATNVRVFDPNTLTWSSLAPLAQGRYSACLVTLQNGNALRIGGAAPNSTNFVEEFDQGTDTWSSKAPTIGLWQQFNATVLLNGEVFIANSFSNNQPEVYDPVADSWSITANLPNSTAQTQVVLPNGKLFVCSVGPSNTLFAGLYTPETKTFTPLPSLPNSAHSQSVHQPNPLGFYIGDGIVAVHSYLSPPRTAFFDIRKRTWRGGGFGTDPLANNGETMLLFDGGIMHLDQGDFLAFGNSNDYDRFPHRQGRYVQFAKRRLDKDEVAPTFAGVVSVVQGTAPDRIFVTWNPASHPRTHVDDINYYVYVANSEGGQDFGVPTADTEIWSGSLSREIRGVAIDSVAYVVVRAKGIRTRLTAGIQDTNVVEFAFGTDDVPPPTFNWIPTAPMHQARAGGLGAKIEDGRYIVWSGITDTFPEQGDIYSETGLSVIPNLQSNFGSRNGSAIDASFPGTGRHRVTSVGGNSVDFLLDGPTLKYFPYNEGWNNFSGLVDNGSSPDQMNIATERQTAIALPFGNILKIGGLTVVGDPASVTNVVEEMNFAPPFLPFYEFAPFTIGEIVTGSTTGAQALILDIWDGDFSIFGYHSKVTDFTVGEVITAQITGAVGTVLRVFPGDATHGILHVQVTSGQFGAEEQILGDLGGDATTSNNVGGYGNPFPPGSKVMSIRVLNEPLFSGEPGFFAENLTDPLGGNGISVAMSQFGTFFQRWYFRAPLNVARFDHSSVLLADGRVLVMGGKDSTDTPVLSAEIYDPTTNVWTLYEDEIVLNYNSSTQQFVVGEVITGLTSGSTGTVVSVEDAFPDGIVHLRPFTGDFLDSESLSGDLGGNAVNGTSYHTMHTHVRAPIVTLLDGTVFIIGGDSDKVDSFSYLTNQFVPRASLDSAKTNHTAHVFGGGQIGVFGGSVGGTPVNDVRLYDPLSETWSTEIGMGTARHRHVSFLLPNNKVLVVGGEDDTFTLLSSAEISS